jgi:dTDP-4-dehydrorhamnose 3,5-epimerase
MKTCKLEGVKIISPFFQKDNRGIFMKDYSFGTLETLLEDNISHNLKEVYYAYSKRGALRGMHFQRAVGNKKGQAKLVTCLRGKILDIAVDLRKKSKTFMKYEWFLLSGDNPKSIYIPEGFAHGYLVLDDSIVSSKADENFSAEGVDGIIYNDKDINIKWPIGNQYKGNGNGITFPELILSDKDKNLQSFQEFLHNCGGL